MPYAPGQTTGFNSVGDYLDANRDTLANEAGAVSSDALGNLGSAQQAADQVIAQVQPGQPDYTTTAGYSDAQGKIQDAEQQAQNLTDPGMLGDALAQHYGLGADQQQFDGNLLAGSNPNFSNVNDAATSLSNYLDNGAAAQAAKPVRTTDPAPTRGPAQRPDDPPPDPKDPEQPYLPPWQDGRPVSSSPTFNPSSPTGYTPGQTKQPRSPWKGVVPQ